MNAAVRSTTITTTQIFEATAGRARQALVDPGRRRWPGLQETAVPKVSFVVTVYNKAPFLPHVAAALAAQAGAFDREFIFVNDGSSDASRGLLQQLTAQWRNVHIIDQENAGPSAALNAGLRRATGDFVKPLDADDVLTPWATRCLIDAVVTTGCQVAYSEQQHSYDVTISPQQVLAGLTQRRGEVERRDDMLRRSFRRAQTNPTAWLACADLVRRSGGCDTRIFIQDYSIELRLARKSGFAHVDTQIYLSPMSLEGRLSGNEAQILHDMNLALAHFLSDHTDIPSKLRRYAFARAAGRASAWARRRARKGPLSSDFLRYLGARTGMMPPSFENCRATCRIFRETNEIRLVADGVDAPHLTADAV
jgi:glycosyltransferase involved in cell wall biosynthesis